MHSKIYTAPFQEKFWAKVDKTNTCWIWTGAFSVHGYGYMWVIRQKISCGAHRIAYAIANGNFNQNLCVCHACDNPSCVNPAHLFLGTRADNNKDKVSKGRQPHHRGATNPNAKITEKQRAELIRLVKSGKSQTEAAPQFGISQVQVSRIVRGVQWSN